MESHSEAMNPADVSGKRNPFEDLSKDELVLKCKALLAIAQKAKQAKTEMQNEVESYKLQLDKCETEKKVNLDSLHTLQELVDSLTEQKLNYITEVDSAKGKIKTLTIKCKDYEEEINKYKADVIVRDKNLADTAQTLSDLDSEIISLKRQNNRLLEENEQLINQLSELEAQTVEFNNIGLEQRKQLQMLEDKVYSEEESKNVIENLNKRIKELEDDLKAALDTKENNTNSDYENKIKEITQLYESEKNKKERANIKLRSYKDKILKCATCINQLKNSRFILTKTIKEYSENIPKWQNDIIKASKVLDDQLNELNNENSALKRKVLELENRLKSEQNDTQFAELQTENTALKEKLNDMEQSKALSDEMLEKQISQVSELKDSHSILQSELSDLQAQMNNTLKGKSLLSDELDKLKAMYQDLNQVESQRQIDENKIILLTAQINEMQNKYESSVQKVSELSSLVDKLENENQDIKKSMNTAVNTEFVENLQLQMKALESEKSMLVKEKLNARDNVIELENRNKILSDQLEKLKSDLQETKAQYDRLQQEKTVLEKKYKSEKESETTNFKCNMMVLQEQYDLLKKEHDNLQDLNGLLKEEVDTLKLSLEQPRPDDNENLSDLNVSLQADIVKLETKLSAYKQDNASLLAEVKESRAKVKEFDNLAAEYDDAKSKLSGYKTENTELLNEMKEINQVLKERGESISKLQKAIAEMERLVETLEKDRAIINQEKEDLQKKVSVLESDLQNAEQNTNKTQSEAANHLIEKANAMKFLEEKEAVIASLREEIDRLKQQQSTTSELPNEDMSTSTISKAEEHSRMKDLDETFEEKYTKLRLFALKLKKKLNETVNQLQNAEQDKAKLEKLLNDNEKVSLPSSSDEVDGCKGSEISDLQAKIVSLTAAVEASENVTAELEKLKTELETKTQQLTAEIEAHKITKDNLEKARRDAKKKNVLSLEMEDYERSMKELTSKMEEKKKKMVQMESTIDTQEGTITAMKTQIKLLEDQIKAEETQIRLTKEELQRAIEEGKEKDDVIQNKNSVISKLEQDLEDEKRKNEEADLEMTAVLSEKEKVIMSLGDEKIELNNKVKRLEFKCAELNETLRITNIELADLKTEYTSYKVRAQAVLRQNQTVDHSQEEQLKEETAALRAQIEAITAKLTTAQEQCSELTSEVEAARRRAAEASGEAARAHQRTARLQADLTRLSHQLDSERAQHNLQVSTLTQCYKTQISDLESKLQKETELLKKQLVAAQEAAKTVPGTLRLDEANHNQYMLPVIPKEEGSDGEMDINVSMIPREEGEGSESAPSPPPSKPYLTGASGRSPVSLERLLEEGVPDDEALDATSLALTPEQEISDLRRRLGTQQQRVKHVTVLLAESERECARMAQLSELLKAELRRAHGSTHGAHNAEYMKNVTLKFLTLPPGDERSRLVPVLQKILTLTPDETNKVHAVAKGLDPNPSKGWGSYLPWPGGK
ncbi:GRIP and coiled-coil domain-containing protein 2-like isoform X1 [Ostrinia nubilalis]|uniref:GRIP and coiled-coil domain-containing protein 2-like isoform X1 n=1 Tax=Ostrinia nubilalis TaxID=29057 RepID=UPI003082269F